MGANFDNVFDVGATFSDCETVEILSELVDEFVEKLEFEFRVNSRIPKNANMKIRMRRNTSNMNSIVKLQHVEMVQAEELLEAFKRNLNPPINTLQKRSNMIENIQIIATF